MRYTTVLITFLIMSSCFISCLFTLPQVEAVTLSSPSVLINDSTQLKTSIDVCTADDGRIYVLWSERDTSSEHDVYVSYSSNNGSTFSPAIRVNNEANGNQFYPSMATDDASRLFVAWQDAYSDSGNIILSRSDDGGRTFQEIHVSNQEDGTQAYPDVAVNGNDVAIVWEEYRSDNTIRIWRGSNGAFVRELQGHTAAVRCVEYSPDGTKLASGAEDSMVKLWNPQTGNIIQNITDHTKSVMSLNWSRDGSMLVTGSWDYKVIIFDTSDFSVIDILNQTDGTNISNPVNAVSFSPDGDKIAVAYHGEGAGAGTGPVKMYNLTVWNLTDYSNWTRNEDNGGHGSTPSASSSVTGVEFSHNGTYIASCSLDNTVKIWNANTSANFASVSLNKGVISLTWSPDDTEIAVGLANGSIAVLNVSAKNIGYWLKGTHTGRVNSVAWHPVEYIASGAADPNAKVWHEPSGTERFNLSTHVNSVYSTGWSPNGGYLVTAGGNSREQSGKGESLRESQIFCAVSTDSGLTFSPPVIVEDTCSRERWRPKIGMDANSDISIVWYDSRNGYADIYFANSTDMGNTFSSNIGISTDSGVENTPEIAVEDNGKVHLIWQYNNGVSIRYANSSDNFQNSIELASDGQMPRIAASPTGSAVWAMWRLGDHSLITNISYDNGASFDDSSVVTSDSVHGSSVSVDAYNQTSLVWKSWDTINHNIYYRGTILTDTWGPCVTGSKPYNGETNVPIFDPFPYPAPFQLNFSEPMDKDSVKSAFSWSDGTTTWTVENCSEINWNSYGDEVSFIPTEPLHYLISSYYVTLNRTATDLAGNPLQTSFTFSFTTSDDIDPPIIEYEQQVFEVNYDEVYMITANITDQWGTVKANSTKVYYQGVGDATPVNALVMTNVGGDTYNVMIPAQMVLGNVSYYIEAKDAFDNTATLPSNLSLGWFNYSVVDHTDPEINHVQSIEWPVNQQIDIWAVVLDNIELVSVELQYKGVSDMAFSSVPMQSNGSTNTYNCTIQAQYDIGYFQYNIEAVDGSDNVNTTVVYSMLITDLTKPEIIFVNAEHIANQTKVLIQANVTDDVELDEVILYFRAVGGNRWVERPMRNVGGSLFEYTIPAQRKSGTIYYYVNATDTAGNVASTLEADQYYEIDVIGVGIDWTPYIILSVILIILMVVLIYQLSKRFGKGSEPGREMPTDDDFQTEEIGEPPEQLDEPQVDIEPENPKAEPEDPRVDA